MNAWNVKEENRYYRQFQKKITLSFEIGGIDIGQKLYACLFLSLFSFFLNLVHSIFHYIKWLCIGTQFSFAAKKKKNILNSDESHEKRTKKSQLELKQHKKKNWEKKQFI